MSNGLVYMFGDSHTAGHELGLKSINADEYLKEKGFNTQKEAFLKLSDTDYNNLIQQPWLNKIGNFYTPLLSWAGQIASKLNKQFVNFAVSGSSIDEQTYKLLQNENKIDWEKDLVLFGVPTGGRYMVDKNNKLTTAQLTSLNAHSLSKQKLILKYIPSNESLLIYHYGCLTYIKHRFPKVIICEMRGYIENIPDIEVKVNDIFYVSNSLKQFSKSFEDRKYPGKHYKEEIHRKYADYVLEKLTSDERYSKIVL